MVIEILRSVRSLGQGNHPIREPSCECSQQWIRYGEQSLLGSFPVQDIPPWSELFTMRHVGSPIPECCGGSLVQNEHVEWGHWLQVL